MTLEVTCQQRGKQTLACDFWFSLLNLRVSEEMYSVCTCQTPPKTLPPPSHPIAAHHGNHSMATTSRQRKEVSFRYAARQTDGQAPSQTTSPQTPHLTDKRSFFFYTILFEIRALLK